MLSTFKYACLMGIYYEDDFVTLYHGDCLTEHREWLDADVLVTDPPYGIGWSKGTIAGRGAAGGKSSAHQGIQNDQDTTVRDDAIAAFGERPGIVFGSFRAPFPAGVKQTLVWQKPVDAGVVGSTTGYRTDTELIFLLGEHVKRPPRRSSLLTSAGGVNRYRTAHPHSKPVPILESLIEWTDGVVADPFAGSGSTLIAAKNLGRKAVGVELEERYCEMIAKRCSQDLLELEWTA